jgi:hypothetical protein
MLQAMAHDGDFAKRHLINPVVLRMLGNLTGLRVLDAGCGDGYLSRTTNSAHRTIAGPAPTRRAGPVVCRTRTAHGGNPTDRHTMRLVVPPGITSV